MLFVGYILGVAYFVKLNIHNFIYSYKQIHFRDEENEDRMENVHFITYFSDSKFFTVIRLANKPQAEGAFLPCPSP